MEMQESHMTSFQYAGPVDCRIDFTREDRFMTSVRQVLTGLTLASVFVLFLTADVLAQGPGGGSEGMTGLLRREEVVQALAITPDQQTKLQEIQSSYRNTPEFRAAFGKIRDAKTPEARAEVFAEMRTILETKIVEVLKPEQARRLTELVIQRDGTRSLTDNKVTAELKLSDDQKAQIKAAFDKEEEARTALRADENLSEEDREAKRTALRTTRDAAVMAVLTAEQKTGFQQQQGTPFAFSDGVGGLQTVAVGNGSSTGVPSGVVGAAPVGVPGGLNRDGTSGAGEAVVSFGSGSEVKRGEAVKEMQFNFRFAPWVDVLRLFAEAANLTLDLNAIPPGSFNYYDDRKYTPTEALDILNGYLLQQGYILVRRDEFLVAMNFDNPIPPNLIPTVSIDELSERGRNELLTVIMPLGEGLLASDVGPEVESLVGPQGKVVTMAKANRLVVTDIGSNLRRIHNLLTGVIVPVGDKDFRQFKLEHIPVFDAEAIIRDLFALQPRGFTNVSAGASSSTSSSTQSRTSSRFSGGFPGFSPGGSPFGGGDPRSRFGGGDTSRGGSTPTTGTTSSAAATNAAAAKVQIAIDERTNSLLVTATPDDMAILERAIESLDVPGVEGEFAQRRSEPYLEVYQLNSADPIEVSKTLNALYPNTVVNEDGRARRLHIKTTPEVHTEIRKVINQLDGAGGGQQVSVIPLGRLDSYTATSSIQQLFLADGTNAPVVQPHPTGNGLLVRGTEDQVTQIKLLMTQLDSVDSSVNYGTGNIRTIPLGGRDPEEFLRALREVWNTQSRNQIRTVIPSQSGGAIKDRRIPSIPLPVNDRSNRPSAGDGASLSAPARSTIDARMKPPAVEGVADDIAALFLDSSDDLNEPGDEPVAVSGDIQLVQNDSTQSEPPKSELSKSDTELVRDLEDLFGVSAAQATASDGNANAPYEDESGSSASASGAAPIAVTIQGDSLILASEDLAALDELQDTISRLSMAMPPKTQWTVFYLQSADATTASTMLERLFPTSSVSSTADVDTSGFLGSLSSGLNSMGRGIIGMTGLDSLTSGPQTLRIIPDIRSNSLFVTGPAHLIAEVEDVLRILDLSELPEQLRDRAPRYIPVQYATVSEVAEIIESVYSEELTPPQQQQQRGQNPLAAAFGGGNSGGNSPVQRVKMTLAVDYQNSQLIVSCNDQLYQQVAAMVADIDRTSLSNRRTIKIVSLEHANTKILQDTIGALMPTKRVSTSSSRSTPGGGGGGGGPQPASPQGGGNDAFQELIRQRLSGGGGGRSGGGFPGGGFPGGGGGFPGGGGFTGGGRFGGGGGFPGGGGRGR
jgi:type II secretory pathway component GspD/PulD (secretin)/Spy/CpxP family protein refolding chaperone